MSLPRPLTVCNLRQLQMSRLPPIVGPAEWAASIPPPTIDPLTNLPLASKALMVPPRLAAQPSAPARHHLEDAPSNLQHPELNAHHPSTPRMPPWLAPQLDSRPRQQLQLLTRTPRDPLIDSPPPRTAVPVSSFRSTIATPIAPHPTILAPTRGTVAISAITATAPPPSMDITRTTGIFLPGPTPIEDIHEVAAQAARDLLSSPRRFRVDPDGSFREPMTDADIEDSFYRDSREWHLDEEGIHWSPYSGDCVPSRWGVRRHKCWYWVRTRVFRRDRTVQAWKMGQNRQIQRRAFRL